MKTEEQKKRIIKRRQLMKVGRIAYNRFQIFERDDFQCWICGRPVLILVDRNDPEKATIDHVIPVSKGGVDAPSNVKCCHRSCNEFRGNRNYVQLRLF